jgi:hypothetical protein
MTTQDLHPTTDPTLASAIARLQYALGCDAAEAEAILTRDPERRREIAEFVRRDEAENADFYQWLGDR